MTLLSVAEALARVTDGLDPLEPERVPLAEALRRVLAEDLAARLTQPPFDASAMDGYAVRAADVVALPARLAVIGEAAAGSGFGGKIGAGEAVRIYTGAPVPRGADTVVIQENTIAADGVVTVTEAAPGRHIRPCGQDFAEGDVLLYRGTRLAPREVMLAAAMNHAEIPVTRRPKVAILSTGNEVVSPGSVLGPDQIVGSVSYGLGALVEARGGEAIGLGIAKDTHESLITLIRTAAGADILVTIGGASVGERDLVASALRAEGLDLDFWKIAMRPGKPLLHGRLGRQRVLGVPGNPVAALICGIVFLVPMLHRLLGLREGSEDVEDALLGESLGANGPRQHYLRATSRRGPGGERVVAALPAQDSSLMADFARADCLIVRAPLAPALEKGDRVTIIPLGS